jgi:carbamoyltransferase
MPGWWRQKLKLEAALRDGLGERSRARQVFVDHHESHAASAFYPSPFSRAAILTMDGAGEWATATRGVGEGSRIELSHELRFPHSLGLLYSAFTAFAGFKVNSGEYKLMGLAPHGTPRFAATLLDRLVDLKEDGSFRLDLRYFDFHHGLTMTNSEFEALFGGPARVPEAPLTERERDLAASIQAVTEEIVLRAARHLRRTTGAGALVMAGGVALNSVANGRVLREAGFDRVWVQPAAGDAGGALGAACLVWHDLLEGERAVDEVHDRQRRSLLGPSFSDAAITAFLQGIDAPHRLFEDETELLDAIVDQLALGKIIGFVQDRMEFGPRALGARSILADPRVPDMRAVLNEAVKLREAFRPFAPSVLREEASAWFELSSEVDSPYMGFVVRVDASRRTVPAVTHVDGSARVQTVDASHGRFYRLIRRFHERTGCPMLVNTSFNVRGEPIVCSPADAYRCFLATGIDVLVLERHLLYKGEQPKARAKDAAFHLAQVEPD